MTPRGWLRGHGVHGPDPDRDVRDEFAFHLEERIEALVAKGMTESAAREQALRQFGDIARATSVCKDIDSRRVRRVRWSERLHSIGRDVSYAVRTLRRAPGFTFAAIATIALGIGANTVVFSLLNALLLQPLDASRPDELVRIYTSEGHELRTEIDRLGGSSYADYENLRQSPALAGLAAYTPFGVHIKVNDATSRFEARIVSENFFAVLDRPLFLGGWTSGETGTQLIVSHRFWQSKLGGDAAVLGRSLDINGQRVAVAGVAAPDFKGIEPSNVDLYFPFRAAPLLTGRAGVLSDRGERSVKLIGRLAPGATAASAEQALNGVMTALGAEFPASNARRTIAVREASSIVPLEQMGKAVLPTAALVFAATLVMLAISGINIAAVLLARTIRRRRELAVRRSLGASAFRLVRQLLTESVVLALAAGIVVLALVSLLSRFAGALGVPASVRPAVDATVLGYAIAVAVGFGALFGLAPALAGMRSDVVESLRGGEATGRPAKARAQRLLVGCQIAFSMLLLLVSGALLGSLARQQRIDPGFVIDRLIVANFEGRSSILDAQGERAFGRFAAQRLGGLPGVASVTVASMAPLDSDGMRSTIHIPDYVEQPGENMDVSAVIAGPDFFRTLGIPLRAGRELTWQHQDTLRYVVVNELMARKYWGNRNPVGSYVRLGGREGTNAEVIGVASNARFYSLAEPPQPLYVVQQAGGGGYSVLVRAQSDVAPLLLAVRGSMARNEVPAILVRLRTMEDVLRNSLDATRAVSYTLMTIGVLAVLLAAVGLYGVVSHVMAGRTREFGVRLALGASPSSLTRLVLGYGMRLAVVGGVVGLMLGFVVLRLLAGMISGSWSSVPVGAAVAFVLCAVMLLACVLPAIRATAIAPVAALRSD